jgi:hypothetical protein
MMVRYSQSDVCSMTQGNDVGPTSCIEGMSHQDEKA